MITAPTPQILSLGHFTSFLVGPWIWGNFSAKQGFPATSQFTSDPFQS